MATIITKNSSTASSVPAAGSLQQGELAVNVTDKKLYTKDSSAAVVKLVGSLGNQEASAVAITGGTINGTAIGGTSTSTGAFTTVSASGGFTGNLTGNASTVTNGVYTTGSYADPTWITSLAGSKITGNISGNATNVTGTVAIANGGTGLTALGTGVQTALGQTVTGSGGIVLANSPALVTPNLGTPSAATLTNATGLPVSTGISGLGTNVATALGVSVGSVGSVVVNGGVLGTPSSGTLTNATGLPLSTGVTGTLAVANGGTGQTTANAAFNALAPSQTSNAGRYLKTDGTNTSWDLLDISTADITGTLPVANGGTGLTSFTANGVLYASSSSALTTGSALTFDGTSLGIGGVGTSDGRAVFYEATAGSGAAFYSSGGNSAGVIGTTNEASTSNGLLINAFRSGGKIAFNVAGSEQMRLTSTGLGIGTSSPSERLEVVGVAKIRTSGGSGIQIVSAATPYIQAFGASGNNVLQLNGQSISFWSGASYGAESEKMRLDSSGNLGLGVTPSAWSLLKAVQIGNASFAGYSATGYLMTNAYFDGSVYKYTSSNYANLYTQNNSAGQHAWYIAASGTAGNTISFTQAMTLDADGDLGIGVTSPAARLDMAQSGNCFAYVRDSSDANRGMYISSGTAATGVSLISTNTANRALAFGTNDTERARITSGGNIFVASTGTGDFINGTAALLNIKGASTWTIKSYRTGTSSVTHISFENDNGQVGTITTSGSATAYNTSSDYRLKDNLQPLTGSGAFIDALKPKTWAWKADGTTGVGFIAHEVQEVSPNSVVGEKDAVDADGNPVMQGMEYGSAEFIANIIAELQSLRARVAQLEAK